MNTAIFWAGLVGTQQSLRAFPLKALPNRSTKEKGLDNFNLIKQPHDLRGGFWWLNEIHPELPFY